MSSVVVGEELSRAMSVLAFGKYRLFAQIEYSPESEPNKLLVAVPTVL